MPELPDVELFRRYMNATALSQKISRTEVVEPDMLRNVSSARLARKLKRGGFHRTHRHGKYLFTAVDDRGWLVLHFGMTGFLQYFKNGDQRPEHTRLFIHFDNEYVLSYVCQRKLGRIDWTETVEGYLDENDLGPDALGDDMDEEEFKRRISGNRGTIKPRLMNQNIIAGLGNIYTDEILFRAGIHPKAPLVSLSDHQRSGLFSTMKRTLHMAINRKVDPAQFPEDSLLPRRNEGDTCPVCGGTIKNIRVSGRGTYFCSRHQKEVE